MLIGADECPLDSLPEMQFCAAQGRDHSKCCVQKVSAFMYFVNLYFSNFVRKPAWEKKKMNRE